MRTWFMRALLVPLLGYLIYVVGLWVMQDNLLFRIPGGVDVEQLELNAAEYGVRPVRIQTADNESLYGWLRRAGPGGSDERLLIYFHGEGETIAQAATFTRSLTNEGWSALTVAFRGYPGSTGRPTEEGLYQDALAIWTYAVDELKIPPERIVFHGRGLGGAVAVKLANDSNPAALVLESTWLSLPRVARERAPIWPASWLLRHRFNTEGIAHGAGVPALVIHGTLDQEIGPDHGKKLATRFAEGSFLATEQGHGPYLVLKDNSLRAGYLSFLNQAAP